MLLLLLEVEEGNVNTARILDISRDSKYSNRLFVSSSSSLLEVEEVEVGTVNSYSPATLERVTNIHSLGVVEQSYKSTTILENVVIS